MTESTEFTPVVWRPGVASRIVASSFILGFVGLLLWALSSGEVPIPAALVILVMIAMAAFMLYEIVASSVTLGESELVITGWSTQQVERSRVIAATATPEGILVSVEGHHDLNVGYGTAILSTPKQKKQTDEALRTIREWAGVGEIYASSDGAVPSTNVLPSIEPITFKASLGTQVGASVLAVFVILGLVGQRVADGAAVIEWVITLVFLVLASVALYRLATTTITLEQNEITVKKVLGTRRADRSNVSGAFAGNGLMIAVRGQSTIQTLAFRKNFLAILVSKRTRADEVADAINQWAGADATANEWGRSRTPLR